MRCSTALIVIFVVAAVDNFTVLNAEIAEIVKREDVLRAEIDRIIAEIEVNV